MNGTSMTDQMTIETTEAFLNSGDARPSPSLLFGEMVKLAFPVMVRYHSDLYHDAMWLSNYLEETTTFFWGLRTTGTSISMDIEDMASGNERIYMVEVYDARNNSWHVRFTPVKPLGTSRG